MSGDEYVTAPSGKKIKRPRTAKKQPAKQQPTGQTWSVDRTDPELTSLLGDEGEQLTVETKNLTHAVAPGDVLDSNFEPLPAQTKATKENTAELQKETAAQDTGADISTDDTPTPAAPSPPAKGATKPPATGAAPPAATSPTPPTATATAPTPAPWPQPSPATQQSSFPKTAAEQEQLKAQINATNPPHTPTAGPKTTWSGVHAQNLWQELGFTREGWEEFVTKLKKVLEGLNTLRPYQAQDDRRIDTLTARCDLLTEQIRLLKEQSQKLTPDRYLPNRTYQNMGAT